MIPASYLFKQVYHQHWEKSDAPAAENHRRFLDGLMTPIARASSALFARRKKRHGYHLGSHAYD